MEGSVFPAPAVAGVLGKHYVEARLHTDRPQDEGRKAMQAEMTNDYSNPVYVLFDPVKRTVIRKTAGYVFESDFVEFLESGLR